MRHKFVVCMLTAILALGSGCASRWVYIRLETTTPGTTVQSKGLGQDWAMAPTRAPAGHFLPCGADALDPTVKVQADHWSYLFSKDKYNDEQKFVERKDVAKFCADSKEKAKQNPFRVEVKMFAISSEEGLKNSIKITSQPAGVSVYYDKTNQLIGRTPFRPTFVFYAPYNVPRIIRFELPGYVTLKRKAHARTLNIHVNMYRPGETPPPQLPPKKKRKLPTAPGATPEPGGSSTLAKSTNP